MAPRSCLLLVEDDFALGETLGDALDDMGFDVVVVCNGAQAIAELDAHAAEFEEVITDVDLGTGPNGWDVGRRARECVADMPVVYMSGNSGGEWSLKGVADSVFISKPFALAKMVEAHDTACSGRKDARLAKPSATEVSESCRRGEPGQQGEPSRHGVKPLITKDQAVNSSTESDGAT
jgi:DNA-binding response OmpR family regulator